MDLNLTTLSQEDLNALSQAVRREKDRRVTLHPQENLEKSIQKTYPLYQRVFNSQEHPERRFVSGWTFEQFREVMLEYYADTSLENPQGLPTGTTSSFHLTPIFRLLEEKKEEWRRKNNSTLNQFCSKCDRYFIGEECPRCS